MASIERMFVLHNRHYPENSGVMGGCHVQSVLHTWTGSVLRLTHFTLRSSVSVARGASAKQG